MELRDSPQQWIPTHRLTREERGEVRLQVEAKWVQVSKGQQGRRAHAKTPREREFIQRQIATTDKQIDTLVYELYGLTEDEVRIVQGGSR